MAKLWIKKEYNHYKINFKKYYVDNESIKEKKVIGVKVLENTPIVKSINLIRKI